MIVPTAYELHIARELAVAGGGTVVLGGIIGGFFGAANSNQDGWESSAVSGVMWGCLGGFVLVLFLGSSW
jgi:hypothetical protein